MGIRRDIRTVSQSPNDLLKFRLAMEEIQKNGAYHDLANYHGAQKHFCHRTSNDLVFLAWHRYYIYSLEQELLKVDPTVTLPYWNWTDTNTFNSPIAPAHSDKTFIDNIGTVKDNPLYSALIADGSRKTVRGHSPSLKVLNTARSGVDTALNSSKTLLDLNNKLVVPHNNIHTGVAGDFGNQELAAYDPLFWSHHAEVDRQWAIWQANNPSTVPPGLDTPFDDIGFPGIKVSDVMDYKNRLGYSYDNLIFTSTKNYTPIILTIIGIPYPKDSFYVDVLLIIPAISGKAEASSFGVFGMGNMPMSLMHQTSTFNAYLDITEAVNKLGINWKDIDPVKHIRFQAYDLNGEKVDSYIPKFKEISIGLLK